MDEELSEENASILLSLEKDMKILEEGPNWSFRALYFGGVLVPFLSVLGFTLQDTGLPLWGCIAFVSLIGSLGIAFEEKAYLWYERG